MIHSKRSDSFTPDSFTPYVSTSIQGSKIRLNDGVNRSKDARDVRNVVDIADEIIRQEARVTKPQHVRGEALNLSEIARARVIHSVPFLRCHRPPQIVFLTSLLDGKMCGGAALKSSSK